MTPSTKIRLQVALILAIAILGALFTWPKGPNWLRDEVKLHLGLDLAGGAHLVYQADVSDIPEDSRDSAVEGTRDVIERRVNAFGVGEPVVQTNKSESGYRIIVELPGVTDIKQAIKKIGDTPVLEFKEQQEVEVSSTSDSSEQSQPNNKMLFWKNTHLSGEHLKKATVVFDQKTSFPIVSLEFNKQGGDLFEEITGRNVGKQVAIFLDGAIISAPRVNEKISGGSAVISGNFTIKEAQDLVKRLNAGALPVNITLISQQQIGPSLGHESLQKSFLAGVLGMILVIFFMIAYYRLPGLVASIALIIYSLIIITFFKLIPVVLTLAGVAGFILTIGLAVDANVLIFERLKEELRAGKTLQAAIDQGFKRAWSSIRDSNISTLITAFILMWLGESMIKGFGITLGIGILVSMFSAITITRVLLKLIARHGGIGGWWWGV